MGTAVTTPYAIWGVDGQLPLLMMYAVHIDGDHVVAQGVSVLHDLEEGRELTLVERGEQLTAYIYIWRKIAGSPTILVPKTLQGNYLNLEHPAKFLIRSSINE